MPKIDALPVSSVWFVMLFVAYLPLFACRLRMFEFALRNCGFVAM